MTKGTSTRRKNRLPGYLYGNCDPGDQDKLMITYKRESTHDYIMRGACGVVYQGEMHFFGGEFPRNRQHFKIEMQRSGKLVQMTELKDLEFPLSNDPSCSSFEINSNYFPWFSKNIVILCFCLYVEKSCYSFDGKLAHIRGSNFDHYSDGLTKYKSNLITVGSGSGYKLDDFNRTVLKSSFEPKTELMNRSRNGTFIWSEHKSDFTFGDSFNAAHSLVTIPSSHFNEECVLVICGDKDVFKFNGTWNQFGQLNKPRYGHSSIYWNGAVYVIGGFYGIEEEKQKTKMEIWKIKDSPDQFQTAENWPELYKWTHPFLFIVPDSFFPGH